MVPNACRIVLANKQVMFRSAAAQVRNKQRQMSFTTTAIASEAGNTEAGKNPCMVNPETMAKKAGTEQIFWILEVSLQFTVSTAPPHASALPHANAPKW